MKRKVRWFVRVNGRNFREGRGEGGGVILYDGLVILVIILYFRNL